MEVKAAIKKIDRPPFLIDVLLNLKTFEKALINTGCLYYLAFNSALVCRLKLLHIPIKEQASYLQRETKRRRTNPIKTYMDLDVDRYKERIFTQAHMIKKLAYPTTSDNCLHHNKAVYQAGPQTL